MILITGGMGFIGLHTARSLLDAGETVLLTQFRATRTPDFINDEIGRRVTVERLDIADGAAVIDVVRKHHVTGIVHLAVPGLGRLSPAEEYQTNMVGLFNILEAARIGGVKRLTLASSIAVYVGVPAGPFHEQLPLRMEANNATEAFKKSFELLGLFYATRTGLDVRAARISGIFGPLYHSMSNLPSRLCHAAVHGVTPDFSATRGGTPFAEDETDLCYVKDCGEGLGRLQLAEQLQHRIYNVASGRGTTNRELAAAVQAAVPGAEIALQPGHGPASRPNAYLDISRLREETGYTPRFDLTSAITDYIAWLRRHPE
ncbi:MAG: NAD-dependent epimerase/dehydratase family protein [Dehalococcoidia bacterium]